MYHDKVKRKIPKMTISLSYLGLHNLPDSDNSSVTSFLSCWFGAIAGSDSKELSRERSWITKN